MGYVHLPKSGMHDSINIDYSYKPEAIISDFYAGVLIDVCEFDMNVTADVNDLHSWIKHFKERDVPIIVRVSPHNSNRMLMSRGSR